MATIIDVGHHVLERHPLRDELQTLASRGNSFLILYCVFGSGVDRTHGTLLLQFSPDFPDGLAPGRPLGAVYRINSETCTVGSGLIFLSPAAPTAIGLCLRHKLLIDLSNLACQAGCMAI